MLETTERQDTPDIVRKITNLGAGHPVLLAFEELYLLSSDAHGDNPIAARDIFENFDTIYTQYFEPITIEETLKLYEAYNKVKKESADALTIKGLTQLLRAQVTNQLSSE